MFELGWAELGIIGLVALLVLGPEEFIVVARKAGRMVGSLRSMATHWQRQLEDALPPDTLGENEMTGKKKDGSE